MEGNCQACGKWAELDRCHIQTKKTGGSDDESNLLLMCRACHQFQHSQGWNKLINKYKHLASILRSKGFQIQDVFGVKKLVKYAK